VSRELLEAIETALERWPELAEEVEHLSGESEPYRRWLRIVQWRLERTAEADLLDHPPRGRTATRGAAPRTWSSCPPEPRENGGELLAEAHLDDWIRQVRVFGFSLMRLDIRQESSWYDGVMGEFLADLGIHERLQPAWTRTSGSGS
jgi:phosphoenolpyruvate carboxylase